MALLLQLTVGPWVSPATNARQNTVVVTVLPALLICPSFVHPVAVGVLVAPDTLIEMKAKVTSPVVVPVGRDDPTACDPAVLAPILD